MTYFIFNYERDFLNQFYTLGILGLLIFQLPFIIACLWLAWRFFRTPGQFNFLNFSYLLGMALFFASAFMTGNVIDSLTAASLAAFFLGQRLRAVAWSQAVPEQQNTIPRQIN
jgi:predicted membrane protein